MDYKAAVLDFISILNDTICKFDDMEEIDVTDGYDFLNSSDNWEHYDGYYISSCDWLGGENVHDECIPIPSPCTHNDYMAICKEIMHKTLEYPLYNSHMMHYKWMLDNYVKDFAAKLKSEWDIFKDISLANLSISAHESTARDTDGKQDYTTQGTFFDNSKNINIYNVNFDHEEDNKTTARHETIHFMLGAAGFNNSDDCFIFWFFATIYDAHPYKELAENEKACFDTLITEYNTNGRTSINQLLKQIQKGATN